MRCPSRNYRLSFEHDLFGCSPHDRGPDVTPPDFPGSPFEKAAGYSRAVVDGDFAFVAGTTGYDYATMTMPEDVTSQSRNCFKTIEAVLEEGGFAMADIVRATYYITDIRDADAHFAVCGEVLGEIRPAATILVVAALLKPEMKIEIEVTAKRRSV